MAASNKANVPLILKDLWADGIEDYLYEDRPLFAMLPKSTDWVGDKLKITCKYANGTSVASRFGTAKKNKRVNQYAKMEVETADLFALWSIDNKLAALSRSERGALVRIIDETSTDAAEKFKRRTAWQVWGNGGGAAAQVLSVNTNLVSLKNPNSVRNFDIGDPIEFAVDDGRAGAGVRDLLRVITAIDEDNGILTLDQSVAGLVSANDYIFHEDDYSSDNHVIKGVFTYVCVNRPGVSGEPTSIWGMDRTVFDTRLGGHRVAPSANLIVIEAIKEALTKMFRRSVNTSHIFVSPEIFNEVEMSIEGTVRRTEAKIGKVGFEGIKFTSQTGRAVELYADPDIPLGPNGGELITGLNLSKWKFHSAEEWGHWQTGDGQKLLVEENSNTREGRLGGYGNTYTRAPGQNWVMELGT